MPWQDNAGGGNRGPWGQGPRSSGPQSPDLDDMFKKGQDRFKTIIPRGFGGGKGVISIILVLIALWSFTGIYRVLPGEQGVVLIFGKWDETIALEGLHFTLPAPISRLTGAAAA
jgi:membrane protease subunit HflK